MDTCTAIFHSLAVKSCVDGDTFHWLFDEIHGYTGCKRMGFVKSHSVKLAKGHLLHDEAGP